MEIVYAIFEFLSNMCTWSCVWVYVRAGKPVSSPESTIRLVECTKNVSKAVVAGAPDFFVVLHGLDRLYVLYMCLLQPLTLLESHLLSVFCEPPTHFVHLL